MHSVITDLSQFIECNEAENQAFFNALVYKKVKKKEHLLVEGNVCNFGIFIIEGCIRYYYLEDGVEFTGNFFFENCWYADIDSFLNGKPSLLYIEALEDCSVYFLYKNDFDRLVRDYPVFATFLPYMMEKTIRGLSTRNKSMSTITIEERYLKFIKDRPKVVERVPLKYIASYLGIKPESLSRLRTRLTLNSKS
ncbi:Crp/Fnr family transcriptional regulator [Flavobacterium sp. HTF]|uniref:Crp/Fnr family transcriptional regulator n=1 Tax=Flavobacterium sp. HTF TaxID=2170732 RepID=UPI000D5D4814|nr:Crp/Fnr family transcriptional regulator [Flavobacterium sp. HTF]PWB26818.1 Crp/Fnr family transcriptional regulator [Flavobacterium sp. HTF]